MRSSTATNSSESRRLLARIRAGDAAAFERLFGRHRAYLMRMVELRMDARLRQRVDPSDVVQETHIEAARRLDQYIENPEMPFRLWIRQIARDRLLMAWRRHGEAGRRALGREMPLPDQTSLQVAHRVLAGGPSPSQQMVRDELIQRVREAVAALPERDREILIMRNLEGLSNKEVAEALGLEPAATSKRYGRALLRLRGLLGGESTLAR
jgi:RNA polymerase sigma-70 factor, ECF subfamily